MSNIRSTRDYRHFYSAEQEPGRLSMYLSRCLRPLEPWILGRLIFLLVPILIVASAAPGMVLAFVLPVTAIPAAEDESTQQLIVDPSLSELESMPNRVLIVDNQVVLPAPPAAGSRRDNTEVTAFGSGTLTVTAEVFPSRLIVVDAQGDITGVWSNTNGTDTSLYSLTVRQGGINGPDHPITNEILMQYGLLLNAVDWSGSGQVYAQGN